MFGFARRFPLPKVGVSAAAGLSPSFFRRFDVRGETSTSCFRLRSLLTGCSKWRFDVRTSTTDGLRSGAEFSFLDNVDCRRSIATLSFLVKVDCRRSIATFSFLDNVDCRLSSDSCRESVDCRRSIPTFSLLDDVDWRRIISKSFGAKEILLCLRSSSVNSFCKAQNKIRY